MRALMPLQVVYLLCRGFDPNANPLGVDTLVTVHPAPLGTRFTPLKRQR